MIALFFTLNIGLIIGHIAKKQSVISLIGVVMVNGFLIFARYHTLKWMLPLN